MEDKAELRMLDNACDTMTAMSHQHEDDQERASLWGSETLRITSDAPSESVLCRLRFASDLLEPCDEDDDPGLCSRFKLALLRTPLLTSSASPNPARQVSCEVALQLALYR